MKEIIIIGGGPSGMMAAISAKMHHPSCNVRILEGNDELGLKMKLSGGGRCNVTANVSNEDVVRNVVKNGKFLYSSLSMFGPTEIQTFFIENGCPLKVEDHNRVFPKSNKADDIVGVLRNKLKELNIDVVYQTLVKEINETKVVCDKFEYDFDYVIVATGGKTYPQTGSNGIGYELAKQCGHTITSLLPAEVPLVSNDEVIQAKVLQGLSFKECSISILRKKKVVQTITHDVIITHFGLSGPAALRASYYVLKELDKNATVTIEIDFLPNVSLEMMQKEWVDDSNFLEFGIPKRLLQYIDSKVATRQERLQMLKKFSLNIYTTRGFSNAFVTNGGVSLKEIDPKTMKSKQNDKVSFCGEIMDINAFTGGFNITAALSSGYSAGKNIM